MYDMSQCTLDLTFLRGIDFSCKIEVNSADTGDPIDLSGSTFRAQVRKTASSEEVLAELDIDTSNSWQGILLLSLPASVTEADLSGVWDILEYPPASEPEVLVGGRTYVSQTVTR